MPRYILINRHIVRKNEKEDRNDPPIRISNGKYGKPRYTHRIQLAPGIVLKYDRTDPLPCGAKAYIIMEDVND